MYHILSTIPQGWLSSGCPLGSSRGLAVTDADQVRSRSFPDKCAPRKDSQGEAPLVRWTHDVSTTWLAYHVLRLSLTSVISRPPLLVPAMHVHLLNFKSSDPLSRRMGLNKLDFCMLVLGELQTAYDSAGVFRGVFFEAIRRGAPDSAARPAGTDSMPAATSDAVPDFTASGLTFEDGFFDELMGQGSISSFWDWVCSTEWNV